MKTLMLSLILLFSSSSFANGLIAKTSSHSFAQTVKKLETILKAKKFRIFAKVDHAQNANSADLMLEPNTVVIFGNPKVGTPIMNNARSFGIDLPVKIHIYKNKAGQVVLSYNDPLYLAQRHGSQADLPQIKKMAKALNAITNNVIK